MKVGTFLSICPIQATQTNVFIMYQNSDFQKQIHADQEYIWAPFDNI